MKKRLVVMCLGASLIMCTAFCVGCSYTGIPIVDNYIDEKADDLASAGISYVVENADDYASRGISYIKDNADDYASSGLSYIRENADDYASMGKSFVEEKSSELLSGDGEESSALFTSASDVNLSNPSGDGKNYVFSYGEEEFSVVRWDEHWKIIDSYKIENTTDMVFICQALINVYPIHGADKESFRTAEDMAYEWIQHNIAYQYLPEDNEWRVKSKDVDFNPEDQGKSFIQIYEERTGKEFKLSDFMGK